jgi:hypothetical protein
MYTHLLTTLTCSQIVGLYSFARLGSRAQQSPDANKQLLEQQAAGALFWLGYPQADACSNAAAGDAAPCCSWSSSTQGSKRLPSEAISSLRL